MRSQLWHQGAFYLELSEVYASPPAAANDSGFGGAGTGAVGAAVAVNDIENLTDELTYANSQINSDITPDWFVGPNRPRTAGLRGGFSFD